MYTKYDNLNMRNKEFKVSSLCFLNLFKVIPFIMENLMQLNGSNPIIVENFVKFMVQKTPLQN